MASTQSNGGNGVYSPGKFQLRLSSTSPALLSLNLFYLSSPLPLFPLLNLNFNNNNNKNKNNH